MTATWCGAIGKPISSKVGSSVAGAPAPFSMMAATAVIENKFFMIILLGQIQPPTGLSVSLDHLDGGQRWPAFGVFASPNVEHT
jgi:hypothetical protein